ncbi:MAG: ABC transporter permease [Bdellovibrionales bacterium]|nr:ABC transporter permease [Bdellovibrionales bacterium]
MAILFLLRRYLVPREGNLMSFALWVSVVGVVIGIIQLMLVLSVMSGFLSFLEKKYTFISSDMVAVPKGSLVANYPLGDTLRKIGEVQAVSPFGLGQSMVIKDGVAGVTLEAIDPLTTNQVTPWETLWLAPPIESKAVKEGHWIWLGSQLAQKIGAKVGDTVELLIAGKTNEVAPFTVTAITKFGLYDHDLHYARIDLNVFKKIFHKETAAPLYKIKLRPGVPLFIGAAKVRAIVKTNAQIKTWNQINQNLFLAVEDQKRRLFLVLEIIVALAGVNVISLLMMSSHYRRKDMAILRSMGFRARSVFLFFLAQGAVVGAIGVSLGVGLGILACRLAEKYQPSLLNEAIYNTDRLPFKVELGDICLISFVAMSLCILFSVIPALRAAYARPVEALRYE